MTNVPRSDQFDDVYFSVQDGLAETRHVFLDGNNLPDSWLAKKNFNICETGFGTGLNFLAALKLWLDSPEDKRPNNLHFISFEKYPLSKEYIKEHLYVWGELATSLDMLLAKYPSDLERKNHKLDIADGVSLTLIIGDVNEQIPLLKKPVDCWFLDGFKPSSNPDMWSENVFNNMARLSREGSSFATFTAAGFVRRGLLAQGFDVRKVRGFGRKREMIVGNYSGDNKCA